MNALDAIESWLNEHRASLEAAGAKIASLRSSGERLNHSVALNMQGIGPAEAELVVWESGEAEFATIASDGSINRQHFDDIMHGDTMLTILSSIKATFAVR